MIRRSQTTASHAHEILRLPVSKPFSALDGNGLISPYFQRSSLQEIGTGRDSNSLFLTMIKAFYLGYIGQSAHMSVAVFTADDSGPNTTSFSVPLTVVTSDTTATVQASVQSTVETYTANHFGFVPDTEEWLFTPVGMNQRSESALSLAVETSTGAVGTQVSDTQDSLVMVDLSTTTTASIAGNAALDLVLEVAPTNSATAGDWVIRGRTGNAQALSLAITLQSVQTSKSQTIAYVPAGYYVKVRSTGATGTTSSAVVEARAVLL